MNAKHVFWQALLSAILIFGVGILLGVGLEDSRSRSVEFNLLNSEINVLDSQILGNLNSQMGFECEATKESLINFADKIYKEAVRMEDYDESSQLTSTLKVIHRRYDLLRVMLLTEAIQLNEKCGRQFHTLVYVFQYDNPSVGIDSMQSVFSENLKEIKAKYSKDVLLIPIAGDLNLESIEMIKKKYSINNYPAIIINEKIVVRDLSELKNVEEMMKSSV